MNRVQRALSQVDLDAYARSRGVISAAEYRDLVLLVHKVATGGRVTERDVAVVIQRNPHLDRADLQRGAQWMNAAPGPRDRALRVAKGIAHFVALANGRPVDPQRVLEESMRIGAEVEVQEFSAEVTRKQSERDAQFDRQHRIDEGKRIEHARRTALQNPDTQRRADLERAVAHLDPQPTLYAADRRELLAQAGERIIDKMHGQMVRDADPHRRSDRGDDRRDDIGLQFDRQMVNGAADDELALRDEGLDAVDDVLTFDEARERDKA